MWILMRSGVFSPSKLRVDPQTPQKPRLTPGDEAKRVGWTPVKRTVSRRKSAKTAAGAPVWRRQLEQWHQTTETGASAAS
jgi:hypothetical protein